eukprot:1182506-Prorocentrum_minimum.AAC.1
MRGYTRRRSISDSMQYHGCSVVSCREQANFFNKRKVQRDTGSTGAFRRNDAMGHFIAFYAFLVGAPCAIWRSTHFSTRGALLARALESFEYHSSMLPPRYIKQARVENQTSQEVQVTIRFGEGTTGDDLIQEDRTLAPGENSLWNQKEINMGTWQAIAPVKSIHVESLRAQNEHVILHPVVDSLIEEQHFHIVETEGERAIIMGNS